MTPAPRGARPALWAMLALLAVAGVAVADEAQDKPQPAPSPSPSPAAPVTVEEHKPPRPSPAAAARATCSGKVKAAAWPCSIACRSAGRTRCRTIVSSFPGTESPGSSKGASASVAPRRS